jgi:hypothetical protein
MDAEGPDPIATLLSSWNNKQQFYSFWVDPTSAWTHYPVVVAILQIYIKNVNLTW